MSRHHSKRIHAKLLHCFENNDLNLIAPLNVCSEPPYVTQDPTLISARIVHMKVTPNPTAIARPFLYLISRRMPSIRRRHRQLRRSPRLVTQRHLSRLSNPHEPRITENLLLTLRAHRITRVVEVVRVGYHRGILGIDSRIAEDARMHA